MLLHSFPISVLKLTYIPGNSADTDPSVSLLSDSSRDTCLQLREDKVYARVSVLIPVAPAHLVKVSGKVGFQCSTMSAWIGSQAKVTGHTGDGKFLKCKLQNMDTTPGSLPVCQFICKCPSVLCGAIDILISPKFGVEVCDVSYSMVV